MWDCYTGPKLPPMPTITFEPFHSRITCADGESVFEVGHRSGVPIATICVGKGTCGTCRVKVLSGEEFLTPFNAAETKHLGNVYFITKERLSCQSRLRGGGDVVVSVPPPKVQKKD